MQLTREQVIAHRIATQGLLRDGTSADDLAVLDFGVQDTSGSAMLALDARLAETLPDMPESLALAWTLRGAPHLHRRSDLDRLAGALWPLSDADALTRLDSSASMRKAGVGGLDGFVAGVEALRTIVTAPMGKGAASTALTAATPDALHRYCRACQATHVFEMVLRMPTLPAGIELEPGTAPPVLVPRPNAATRSGTGAATRSGTRPGAASDQDGGGPDAAMVSGPDPDAVQQLIRAYLTLLGPAGEADVAGYLGARRADLVKLWPDDLVQVSVEGGTRWLPAGVTLPRRARPPRITRLLGPFDPYLQARDRDLIVPDKAMHKALWPILGRPGVLFVDGEVVGTWRPRSAKARLEVAVEQFAPLPPPVRRDVEQEAERVAAVRGASDVHVTWTN